MTNSIWNNVECDAWSRDFSYEEYLASMDRHQAVHTPLSKEGYMDFCNTMHKEMVRNFERIST